MLGVLAYDAPRQIALYLSAVGSHAFAGWCRDKEVVGVMVLVRRRVLMLMLAVMLLVGISPVQAYPIDISGFKVALEFDVLPQGTVGLVHVHGEDIAGARANFLNRLIEFYPRGGEWYGLLAADMEQQPGTYPVEVLVWFTDGSRQSWEGKVVVEDGGFIRQDVTIGSNLGYLLDPEIDRSERARLMGIFNQVSTTHYWNGPFSKPTDGEFTSQFGAWRLYNEVLWGRHTGIDMRGGAGLPMLASAAGRIVLAEKLDVRGNYVVIDHGYGVYSGYAHLSEIHVTRGQVVRQGQVLGISGNTGRSSGPHIHWEMAVNGEWINPQQFMELAAP